MTRTNLKDLIELASALSEDIFRRAGFLLPMYHAITMAGENLCIPQPDTDKDSAVALIKAAFVLHRVESYVFMSEAWVVEAVDTPLPTIMRNGLAHHPDRREAVMFSAENRGGERLTGRRYILRPEHGKPKLSPLKIDDMTGVSSSGRMVGLL